jgi:hypothetical protein
MRASTEKAMADRDGARMIPTRRPLDVIQIPSFFTFSL